MTDLDRRLEALRHDRNNGAQALALEALAIAREWAERGGNWASLAAELRRMHPAIALLRNVARRLDEEGPAVVETLRTSLVEGNRSIAAKLREALPRDAVILTLSHGSTVREALPGLQPREVRIFESLPGGEGRTLAERLPGLKTTLFPDAAMGRAAVGADLALVGVDSFDPDGALVHKVGTLPLALVCRFRSIPLYAAGHSLKRVETPLAELPDDPWFDRTPPELIRAILTE
ncbi:MAG: hypothetical protein GC160_26585 [Acidobacteria bacterium]|nr:hypothetical protein [Acidobacteriota bacterium]